MTSLFTTIVSAGPGAGAIWWVHRDGPTRLCAGLVAVFHPTAARRRDARAVLAATKRSGQRR